MDKLKVGIAGYGVVGKRRHHFIDLHPAFEVVAVCDKNIQQPANLIKEMRFFNSYHELLQENLDVLFVCLTNDVAAEVTVAGLEKGLHVFCEKPPGRNLDDLTLVGECKERHPNLVLKYGFNHRYHDSVCDALEIVESKVLGEVINLRGVYGKSKIISFGQNSGWRSQRAVAGGGILLDQGIHMVDLLRLFAGEFEKVHSFISNDYWKHDVEDNAYALMRTHDKKIAMLHSSATQWRHHFNLDIHLTKGALILSGILSGSKSYGAEKLTIIWASENDLGDPKEQTTSYNQDNSWFLEIKEFAEAILDNKNIIHGTFDDAYKTMRLVYEIYHADKEWCDFWDIRN